MIGLGTIINSVCIIIGGLIGHFTGKLFNKEQQDSITKACGVSVLFIGKCHITCKISCTHYDGTSYIVYFIDRICFDFLCWY